MSAEVQDAALEFDSGQANTERNTDTAAIVYDGQCSFCRRQMAWIAARAPRGVFEWVPRETPGLTERFPVLAGEDFDTGLRLVMPDQTVYVGADAVYRIARRLPRWRRLAWLYRVPGLHALARAAYARIAKRRQSLGRKCTDGACEAPPS